MSARLAATTVETHNDASSSAQPDTTSASAAENDVIERMARVLAAQRCGAGHRMLRGAIECLADEACYCRAITRRMWAAANEPYPVVTGMAP